MQPFGVRLWVLAFAFGAEGCGRFVARPPSLDYQEPSVRVDVRFVGAPFAVDFSLARDETERVVAHCEHACRLQLPPALYRIRAYGDGPSIEKVRRIRQHTHLLITMGSSELRALGLGLEVSGALGLGTLTVGVLQSVQDPPSIERHRSGGTNLAIIGGVGAAALGFGILLHQGSHSSFQLGEIEDEAPSASTATVLDANGVGFRF